MKNRAKLRNIVVNNKEYLWAYYYDDMDFNHYPYSYYLFVPKNNEKLKVRVYFTKYAPNMNLNIYTHEGTSCLYHGEQVVLNLCRPYFAKQIIKYVFENCCREEDIGEIELRDGDSILMCLGYFDFY